MAVQSIVNYVKAINRLLRTEFSNCSLPTNIKVKKPIKITYIQKKKNKVKKKARLFFNLVQHPIIKKGKSWNSHSNHHGSKSVRQEGEKIKKEQRGSVYSPQFYITNIAFSQ